MSNKQQAHHPRGMSRLPALAQCPFYEGDDRQSPDATEGQKAHALLALAMAGEPCPVESPHYQAVTWAAEFAQELEARHGKKFDVERRVTIESDVQEVDGVFGTADLCMFTGERIIVIDFKTFGTGEKCHVEQLMGYAHALASEHDVSDMTMPCELYTLNGAIRRYDKAETSIGNCIIKTVGILCDVASRKDGEQCANGHCQYCRHYGACDAQKKLVAAVAPLPDINLITATREEMLARPQDVPVMLVLVKELKKLIDRAQENAGEAIKAHGLHAVDGAGLESWTLSDDVRGVEWQIRQTQGARTFSDLAALWSGYACMHLTQEQFLACCAVRSGELTKAIHTASGEKLKDVERELGTFATREGVRETMRRTK